MATQYNKKLEVTLRPLLILSQILGFTFSNNLLLKKFKLVFVFRGFVISALIVILFFEIPSIAGWTNRATGTHGVLAVTETRLLWITMFFNFFATCLHNSKINKIFLVLLKSPAILKESQYKRITAYQSFIIFGTLTLSSVYNILGNDFLWQSVYNTWCTSTIYIAVSLYVNFPNLQFSIILYITRQFFEALNENLKSINLKIEPSKNWAISFSKYYKDEKLEEIVRWRKLHFSLTSACQKTNQCYSLQILLYFLLVLVELTYSFRSLAAHIVRFQDEVSNNWTARPILELLLTIFWASFYLWIVLNVIVNCERISLESYRSATFVHNLINETNDKDTKKQLQLFSSQLSNCKICFKAGRCLDLNYQLVTSVIGTVMTYLTIIVTVQN